MTPIYQEKNCRCLETIRPLTMKPPFDSLTSAKFLIHSDPLLILLGTQSTYTIYLISIFSFLTCSKPITNRVHSVSYIHLPWGLLQSSKQRYMFLLWKTIETSYKSKMSKFKGHTKPKLKTIIRINSIARLAGRITAPPAPHWQRDCDIKFSAK